MFELLICIPARQTNLFKLFQSNKKKNNIFTEEVSLKSLSLNNFKLFKFLSLKNAFKMRLPESFQVMLFIEDI